LQLGEIARKRKKTERKKTKLVSAEKATEGRSSGGRSPDQVGGKDLRNTTL